MYDKNIINTTLEILIPKEYSLVWSCARLVFSFCIYSIFTSPLITSFHLPLTGSPRERGICSFNFVFFGFSSSGNVDISVVV